MPASDGVRELHELLADGRQSLVDCLQDDSDDRLDLVVRQVFAHTTTSARHDAFLRGFGKIVSSFSRPVPMRWTSCRAAGPGSTRPALAFSPRWKTEKSEAGPHMLRRMKIGTRVNVLIAVPLIALVALTAVSYVSLQRASVRGDEYKQLKAAEQLRSDIVPPPASLLEAWAIVNHISVLVSSPVSDRTNAEITDCDEAPLRGPQPLRHRRCLLARPTDGTACQRAAFESGAPGRRGVLRQDRQRVHDGDDRS